MARKKPPAETKVESIRHKDKRTNIPTEELRDFIADDEAGPEDDALPARPVARPAARLARQGLTLPQEVKVLADWFDKQLSDKTNGQ